MHTSNAVVMWKEQSMPGSSARKSSNSARWLVSKLSSSLAVREPYRALRWLSVGEH